MTHDPLNGAFNPDKCSGYIKVTVLSVFAQPLANEFTAVGRVHCSFKAFHISNSKITIANWGLVKWQYCTRSSGEKMLQNCGISIPALVPPHLERPRYASSSFGAPVRSSHGFPRSQFEPRLSISGTEFPSEAPFPTGRNERNYSDFLPELQASRSVAYPSWSSWRSRPQSVPPFLGHPYGGKVTYNLVV